MQQPKNMLPAEH